MAISSERLNFVDYTHFTYLFTIGFIVAKPKPIDPVLKVLEPIDISAWIGFFLASLAVGFFAIINFQCHSHIDAGHKDKYKVRIESMFDLPMIKISFICRYYLKPYLCMSNHTTFQKARGCIRPIKLGLDGLFFSSGFWWLVCSTTFMPRI